MTNDDATLPSSVQEPGGAAFVRQLRELRAVRGESLADVAKATGSSKAYLHQLEHGRASNPTLDLLCRLSRHFQVSVASLVGEPAADAWEFGFMAGVAACMRSLHEVHQGHVNMRGRATCSPPKHDPRRAPLKDGK